MTTLPADLQSEITKAEVLDAANNLATNPNLAALASLDSEHKKTLIMEYWLKGYAPKEIANILSISFYTLKELLEEARIELNEIQGAKLLDLTAERIEGFRLIKKEAWQRLLGGGKAPHNLLNTLIRVEEDIAKMQGVLSDHVTHSGDITHNLKLYDFDESAYPQPIDAEFKIVEEAPEAPVEEPQVQEDIDAWAKSIFADASKNNESGEA